MELSGQLHERRVRHDLFRRNEQIPPFLITIRLAPTGSNFAILNATLFLGNHIRVIQLVLTFDLHKVNNAFGFHNEIRFIVMPVVIGDVEFLRCRAQPVQHIGIRFKYPCQKQFRMAVKLGCAEHALLDPVKQN